MLFQINNRHAKPPVKRKQTEHVFNFALRVISQKSCDLKSRIQQRQAGKTK